MILTKAVVSTNFPRAENTVLNLLGSSSVFELLTNLSSEDINENEEEEEETGEGEETSKSRSK